MIKSLWLLKIKDQHNISERAFNEILKMIKILYITLYKFQKFLRNQILIELNLVNCYINSCIVFTGENVNKDQCTICEKNDIKKNKSY